MALMKVKGNIERLFDKNLNDLVRGIRNHKEDEGKYIASCLEEIKAELRQHNLSVKTNAVAKLTYLQVGTTRYCVLHSVSSNRDTLIGTRLVSLEKLEDSR